MNAWLRDLSLGLRTLRKSPGLSFVAVLALTFGIGLTTMMFSIVYGALLRGLPFPEGDRIVTVFRVNRQDAGDRQGIPVHDYADLRAQQRSFSHLGAYSGGTMNVSGRERAERYDGTWITTEALTLSGVQPALGRLFREGEDAPGGAAVAILSHSLWRDRYGADPNVLGSSVRVNATPYEVVGVLPEGFEYPNGGDLYLPLVVNPLANPRGQGEFLQVVAKLAPGVSADQANTEVAALFARLAQDYPETNRDFTASTFGFVRSYIGDEATGLLYTMLGAVFFVLLIACSNVANLLLDRAAHRSKEVGVRSALGATRGEVVRVFLAEALVLSAIGTVLGIVLAKVGMDAFNRAIVDTDPPFFIVIDLHLPVLAFAAGTALLAALMSGLIPAYQASRADIAEILKDETRGASSLRLGKLSKALVVFEIALSCGLLVAAGLTIKSVVKSNSRDTGFAMASVFSARMGFPSTYTDTVAQRNFWEQLEPRVAAIPGVRASAVTSGLPGAQQGLGGFYAQVDGKVYERNRDQPEVRVVSATPGFLSTLEIPLRQGRDLAASDRIGALPVALVNERFVRDHYPDGDAIGKRIRLGGIENQNNTEQWMTIVGVFGDIFAGNPEDPRPPVVLRPFAQNRSAFAYVALRTDGDPMTLTPAVREAVASLDPDLPIYWPMTLEAAVAEQLWFVRVFGTMFAIFGLVALFLASIGLYAVMSFSVSRRVREMGIRMALGAQRGRVIRLVFGQGAWQIGLGMGFGLLLAAGVSRLLNVILFDVQPLDPTVFAAVVFTLSVAGGLACLIPARRATQVDPAEAMRTE